ncbi:MAG: HIT domain-containing protein [Chloroflexi bacterium]|nr:HIT domain-containing protein [Chloroflexota bacterium]
MRFKAGLRWLVRSVIGRWLIGWTFAHASSALPVKRLYETPNLVAFHHPRPSYPAHVLIVPKAARSTLLDLSANDAPFLVDLLDAVRWLVVELDLTAYRLIANGGDYQDVPQVHFHLISDEAGDRTDGD